jgi:hypothetical protein
LCITLREEHRPGLIENRVLMRTHVPKREEITVYWRKLHTVELRDFYSTRNTDRVIQWRTQKFFSGGVQKIQLRTDGRENRDRGGR